MQRSVVRNPPKNKTKQTGNRETRPLGLPEARRHALATLPGAVADSITQSSGASPENTVNFRPSYLVDSPNTGLSSNSFSALDYFIADSSFSSVLICFRPLVRPCLLFRSQPDHHQHSLTLFSDMTYTDPNYSNRRYSYVDQYRERPFTHPGHLQHHPIAVKVEDVDSSEILPAPHPQYAQQQPSSSYYRFGGSTNSSSLSSPSSSTPVTPFSFMSGTNWSASSSAHAGSVPGTSYQQPYATNRMHGYNLHTPLDPHPHQSAHVLPPLQDDYDDGDDDGLTELPSGVNLSGYANGGMDNGGQSMSKAGEKQVRRRSSKACDQCRKSKCKCERSNPQEPCKNCVLLGTRTSTFRPHTVFHLFPPPCQPLPRSGGSRFAFVSRVTDCCAFQLARSSVRRASGARPRDTSTRSKPGCIRRKLLLESSLPVRTVVRRPCWRI